MLNRISDVKDQYDPIHPGFAAYTLPGQEVWKIHIRPYATSANSTPCLRRSDQCRSVFVLFCTWVQNELSNNAYPTKNQFNRWGLCNMGGSCCKKYGFLLQTDKSRALFFVESKVRKILELADF